MANIPVEKTSSGAAWLPWLLGLLALAAILFVGFLILDDPDNDDLDDADAVVMDDGVDDDAFVDDPDPMTAAMDMSGLYVTRVVGDRSFYVAPSEGSANETLVILDQNMSPDVPGVEGQVDINAGQTVDLSGGTMQPFGDADVIELGLPDADANALTPTTEVIRIDGGDVEISNADLENVEVE